MNSITPIALACLALLPLSCSSPKPETATTELVVRVVAPATVRQRPVIEALGSLVCREQASLSAGIDGTVERILCKEGQRVQSGQILVELANVHLSIRAKTADSAVRAAKANLEIAEAGLADTVREAEARVLDLQSLERSIAQKRLERERFMERRQQQEALAALDGISPEAIRQLAVEQSAMDTELANLEDALRSRSQGLPAGVNLQQLDSAERLSALVDVLCRASRARVELARVELGNAASEVESVMLLQRELQIRAPWAGTVVAIQRQRGERIDVGTPLLGLFADQTMQAEFPLQEKDLVRLMPGQDVECTIPALNDLRLDSRLDSVAPVVDPLGGSVRIRINLDNPKGILRPGLLASARIYTGDEAPLTRLPLPVWQDRDTNGGRTYLVRNGRAVRHVLVVRSCNGEWVEIAGPLPEGALFIVDPPAWLHDGMEVKHELL